MRFGYERKITTISVQKTNYMVRLLNFFKKTGFIVQYDFPRDKNHLVNVELRYDLKRRPFLKKIILINRPGRQITCNIYRLRSLYFADFPRIYVLSTSEGIMTHVDAIRKNIGGVLLFAVEV